MSKKQTKQQPIPKWLRPIKRRLIRTVYRVLSDKKRVQTVLQKMDDKWRGEYDPNTDTIRLDPCEELIPTAIHECFHRAYDNKDWPIQMLEIILASTMSEQQATTILLLLAEAIKRQKKKRKRR